MSDPIDDLMEAMDEYRRCKHNAGAMRGKAANSDWLTPTERRETMEAAAEYDDAVAYARSRIRSSLLRAVMPEEQGE